MHRGGISLSEMTGNGLLILANEFDEEVVSEPDEMEDSDADDDRRSWIISSAIGLSSKLSDGKMVSPW